MPALEEGEEKCDECQSNTRKDDKKEIGVPYVTRGRQERGLPILAIVKPLNFPILSHCIISFLTS